MLYIPVFLDKILTHGSDYSYTESLQNISGPRGIMEEKPFIVELLLATANSLLIVSRQYTDSRLRFRLSNVTWPGDGALFPTEV